MTKGVITVTNGYNRDKVMNFKESLPVCNTAGRLSVPRRPLSGSYAPNPNAPHLQVCHCEPARTLVWQSVSLQAAYLARPARGARGPEGGNGLAAGAMSLRSSQ